MMTATMPPSADPLREAFHRRALGAIERLTREASPEALVEALAAPSDTGAVARALAEQAAADALRRLEPLAGAITRGIAVRAQLAEAAGGMLSADDVAKVLGITRQAVDKRRAGGKLLAVRIRGDWHYPAAQFRDGETLPGIEDTVAGMPDASAWSVLDFLLAPDDALGGRTPLAALREGDLASVRRLLAARESDASA
jgi:Protein of unknown function (DUF2384)